jgi:chromosomal replication initiation ATPase DnaA
MHHWTETAIATALDGRFFLTDGTDKNAKKREEEEKLQRQRAELVRQRMKKAVEEVVVKDPTDPAAIIKVVAYTHGVGTEDLLSRTRAYHITRARQHACALIRELSDLSYPAIAKIIGLKDHTTVCHAVKTWAKHGRKYAEADAQARKMLGVA